MTRLIVYAGPNGSGKSTLRTMLLEPAEIEIDPDLIARSINPVNPRAADREAGAAALRMFRQNIQARRSLSIETTLSGRTGLIRLRQAKAAGYEVGLYYVALDDIETNVVRVSLRAALGGHYIEPDIVRRRAQSSFGNLPAALASVDRAILFDNTRERHQRILEIDGGVLRLLADPPNWVARLLPDIRAALAGSRA